MQNYSNAECNYLFENILLSHEFLSFSVWFVDHDLENILSIVGDVHNKEHQIFQKLSNRSRSTKKKKNTHIRSNNS